jgi:hypothetical protein
MIGQRPLLTEFQKVQSVTGGASGAEEPDKPHSTHSSHDPYRPCYCRGFFMTSRTPNRILIWQGHSLLTGDPIQAILSGLAEPTSNRKTGDMLQTWILPVENIPSEAIQKGKDAAVCGNCPLRQKICYVDARAPNSVWRANNKHQAPPLGEQHLEFIKDMKLPLRITSYGDAAATPFDAWIPLLEATNFQTGYTHQWLTCDQRWRDYLMASVETEEGALAAQAKGWRTFRIVSPTADPLPNEIICRNTGNPSVSCRECRLCDGAGNKPNIFNPVHGLSHKTSAWERLQTTHK